MWRITHAAIRYGTNGNIVQLIRGDEWQAEMASAFSFSSYVSCSLYFGQDGRSYAYYIF